MRKKANEAWFKVNEISPQLLSYSYNVLMSLEPNSVLLTQHDNDSYPIWMLQDTFEIRRDVKVINIDFVIVDSYRNMIFKDLNLPELEFQSQHINDYRQNWSNILLHILNHYDKSKPLAVGLTITPDLFKSYKGKLSISGLSLARNKDFNLQQNIELYKNVFLLDNIKILLSSDLNQDNIDQMNLNYLKFFKPVYDYYKQSDVLEAERIKSIAQLIAKRSGSLDQATKFEDFN